MMSEIEIYYLTSLFFDNLFSIGTVFAMIIDREKILREDIEREQM